MWDSGAERSILKRHQHQQLQAFRGRFNPKQPKIANLDSSSGAYWITEKRFRGTHRGTHLAGNEIITPQTYGTRPELVCGTIEDEKALPVVLCVPCCPCTGVCWHGRKYPVLSWSDLDPSPMLGKTASTHVVTDQFVAGRGRR